MSGKGSARRPGTGYEANFDAIFRKKEERNLYDQDWNGIAKKAADTMQSRGPLNSAPKLHTDFTQEGEDSAKG